MDTGAEELHGRTSQGNIRIHSSYGEEFLRQMLDGKDTLNRITNCGNDTKNTELRGQEKRQLEKISTHMDLINNMPENRLR